jgi:hypothetical protein
MDALDSCEISHGKRHKYPAASHSIVEKVYGSDDIYQWPDDRAKALLTCNKMESRKKTLSEQFQSCLCIVFWFPLWYSLIFIYLMRNWRWYSMTDLSEEYYIYCYRLIYILLFFCLWLSSYKFEEDIHFIPEHYTETLGGNNFLHQSERWKQGNHWSFSCLCTCT